MPANKMWPARAGSGAIRRVPRSPVGALLGETCNANEKTDGARGILCEQRYAETLKEWGY